VFTDFSYDSGGLTFSHALLRGLPARHSHSGSFTPSGMARQSWLLFLYALC
jgi:hypothetical protein